MNHFVHLHSSSRYDRSVESLTAAATTYNEHADLVTYTEVEFEKRERAVRKANGKEFGFVSGDEGHANDACISYKKDRFELVYEEMFQASELRFYRKGGHMRDPVYATIAVLKDKESGQLLVVAVIHLASSVQSEIQQGNWSYRRSAQWRDAYRNTKRRINRLAKKHRAHGRMMVADWNIDFKKAWARALVKAMAPAYRLTWNNVKVAGGTHGRRIIDATILRGKIDVRGSAHLFKDDPSSDHRPFIETLVWR